MWGLFSKRSREQASARPRRLVVTRQADEFGGFYERVLSLNARDCIQPGRESGIAASARHRRPIARRFARNSEDAAYFTARRQSSLLVVKRLPHIIQARITHRRSSSTSYGLVIIGSRLQFASCFEALA